MSSLDKLSIHGFKSIRDMEDFEFRKLNILVGANGAGKSNLISFFKMIRALMDENLDSFVIDSGGAGDLLYNGRKVTKRMMFEMCFDDLSFGFHLISTPNDTFAVIREASHGTGCATLWSGNYANGRSKLVSEVKGNPDDSKYSRLVYEAISSRQIYHFHDTSSTASMRYAEIVQDNEKLRTDAANLVWQR